MFIFRHNISLFATMVTMVTIVPGNVSDKSDSVYLEQLMDINYSPFYAQLWFWVVIGLIFLFFLILLIRGTGRKKSKKDKNSKKDKEV